MEVARGPDHPGAMSGQSARRLHAEAGRYPGHQDALTAKID